MIARPKDSAVRILAAEILRIYPDLSFDRSLGPGELLGRQPDDHATLRPIEIDFDFVVLHFLSSQIIIEIVVIIPTMKKIIMLNIFQVAFSFNFFYHNYNILPLDKTRLK